MSDKIDQADETIDIFDQVVRERDDLRAEVERLTLADRQWADHVKRLADERERLQGEASRLAEALLTQHVEVERLQAVVETAAAMVRSTDSDLADALLKSLAKPKE